MLSMQDVKDSDLDPEAVCIALGPFGENRDRNLNITAIYCSKLIFSFFGH